MGLKYPIIIILTIISVVIIFVYKYNNKKHNSRKVANTYFIKNTELYKSIMSTYKIAAYAILSLIVVGVIASSTLSSRIFSSEAKNNEIYDRDILLCLDVSGSMTSLDKEIAEAYKNIVDKMQGERFGMTVFDSSAYTLIPLTNDYDYVKDVLDKAILAFAASNNYENYDYDTIKYITDGTMEGSGSSVIGDGFATCVLNFPKIEDNRSRIIILATDNMVAGKEIITVPEAAELAKKYKISVYPITPNDYYTEAIDELKNVANKTGGKHYNLEQFESAEDIISEIEQKEKTLREASPITATKDYPAIPLIVTIICLLGLLIVESVIKV